MNDKDTLILEKLRSLLGFEPEHSTNDRLNRTLVKTLLPLILPVNASGYALDSEGRVVGVKLGASPRAQDIIDFRILLIY